MNSTFTNELGQGKTSTFRPFCMKIDVFGLKDAENRRSELAFAKMILLIHLPFWQAGISSHVAVEQLFPNA
jgi:hypothetical protein